MLSIPDDADLTGALAEQTLIQRVGDDGPMGLVLHCVVCADDLLDLEPGLTLLDLVTATSQHLHRRMPIA